jgi:chromosome segregation protein
MKRPFAIARTALEAVRATVAELDIARATAESDLSHLATLSVDTVQATLDDVVAEVSELEQNGQLTPDARMICAEEPDDASEEDGPVDVVEGTENQTEAAVLEATERALSAGRGDRASADEDRAPWPGQHDGDRAVRRARDASHVSHDATQGSGESIAQTSEAIKRIDATTRERFHAGFAAINTTSTRLFGTLVRRRAAPADVARRERSARKRHRNHRPAAGQASSERATAVGRRKGAHRHRADVRAVQVQASPFCLLDEIDAPLDDANIGRFVEMLRGMQEHTQFILITHNRKTMEIADRLYGVTMEEPGVSKLISVQMN